MMGSPCCRTLGRKQSRKAASVSAQEEEQLRTDRRLRSGRLCFIHNQQGSSGRELEGQQSLLQYPLPPLAGFPVSVQGREASSRGSRPHTHAPLKHDTAIQARAKRDEETHQYTQQQHPSAMNLFRLLGDLSHLASSQYPQASAAGPARLHVPASPGTGGGSTPGRTHELTGIVFPARVRTRSPHPDPEDPQVALCARHLIPDAGVVPHRLCDAVH